MASCAIVTSHGDVYEESAADYSGFALLDNNDDGYPDAFVAGCEVVQFGVPLKDEDLLAEIQGARRRAHASREGRHPCRPATQWMTWDGTTKDLPALGRLDGAAARTGTAESMKRPVHDRAEETVAAPGWRVFGKSPPVSKAEENRLALRGVADFQWIVCEPGLSVGLGEVIALAG